MGKYILQTANRINEMLLCGNKKDYSKYSLFTYTLLFQSGKKGSSLYYGFNR